MQLPFFLAKEKLSRLVDDEAEEIFEIPTEKELQRIDRKEEETVGTARVVEELPKCSRSDRTGHVELTRTILVKSAFLVDSNLFSIQIIHSKYLPITDSDDSPGRISQSKPTSESNVNQHFDRNASSQPAPISKTVFEHLVSGYAPETFLRLKTR